MALSRTAWIAAGIGARLLMIAFLAVSVPFTLQNDTKRPYRDKFYKLESYSYTVAVAVIAMAIGVLQIPVAVYLLCMSKRMTTPASALVLDCSLCADVVMTVLLASGVGAGFGATNGAVRYVHHGTWHDSRTEGDLIDYYNKAIVPLVFLLVGMILSMAATVVSARLRARATDDDTDV